MGGGLPEPLGPDGVKCERTGRCENFQRQAAVGMLRRCIADATAPILFHQWITKRVSYECPSAKQRFFSRKQLRKMHGQDPREFTPEPPGLDAHARTAGTVARLARKAWQGAQRQATASVGWASLAAIVECLHAFQWYGYRWQLQQGCEADVCCAHVTGLDRAIDGAAVRACASHLMHDGAREPFKVKPSLYFWDPFKPSLELG